MTCVGQQIRSADEAICLNIDSLVDQRPLLSQNILAQIRNLVEGAVVLLHLKSLDAEFNYAAIKRALDFVRSRGQLSFLGRFHKLIQTSASHYTLDGDASVRLMLKYYEYLRRVRSLLQKHCGLAVLANLDKFPVDLDPSLREYHEKIASRIAAFRSSRRDGSSQERYYIHKTRPFFVGENIFYEVTFCRAADNVNKFDRIIAFTDIDIADYYSAMLTLWQDSIEVLGREMPITIIGEYKVSIRPCELKNFSKILGNNITVRRSSREYRYLMGYLTATGGNLLDIVDLDDGGYQNLRVAVTDGVDSPQLLPILDRARQLVRSAAPGHNVLRYLMLRMRNQILKLAYNSKGCDDLSGLKLSYGCIPFDKMPFCTSLPGHNPRYWDLAESLDATDRRHELLARRVKYNVERNGMLYTPAADLADLGGIKDAIATYNRKLYYKHTHRRLELDKSHVFIRGYEDDTVSIVQKLQEYASSGIAGYSQAVERWLNETSRGIDDPLKENALKQLFSQSRVALIYGAAGTGKSKMVDHIAHYFNDKKKLFLAHTHPAIDNLKRKVSARNSKFSTISRHIYRRSSDNTANDEHDILLIDECSTVSNANLIKVLQTTSFKLLVLVGDEYQVASIEFGNWFGIVRSFIPSTSVFALENPFRTKNKSLIDFWTKVRVLDEDIAEVMAANGYSTVLDSTLFEPRDRDEIILCLNYDGLYGINNLNRFLQSSNPSPAVAWGAFTYKVGDPVLFFDSARFGTVIYNNLKGWIRRIERLPGRIQFDIELDRPLSGFDVESGELEWLGDSMVRFSVYEYHTSDDDDEPLNTTVPFQVAYAVSIHKAQGLEYDSVKIVITDANEEDMTHNVFYTAVTRARQHLRIYWTPETQQRVLERLRLARNTKDVELLSARRGLKPINK